MRCGPSPRRRESSVAACVLRGFTRENGRLFVDSVQVVREHRADPDFPGFFRLLRR
ncbi:hypothetical protein DB32_005378 [Sandaracinus amylolyticus]|uniref:Uncharacterized protein n=1 Tax=Sandaracinus amylolyticus TaxID=927083 RepID=A0A0F6SG80_9BACT|nr:hypothetical protein DB32_005378 [Sandaracinus amylolyticus]